MDRRLLPYEYQLIEALGVSKEEYLEFVALQQDYRDPKAGTELDVRNDLGVTAIVLTVVGILFQVGAAILAPKPKMPDLGGADNQRRTRQQRFAPSSGFNSSPELASYGDTVNLVYTDKINDNRDGGVRVGGSLVWSAIDNYGSAQFMQLLFVLGAAQILNISNKRTAFGSLTIDQLDPSIAFLFYKKEGGPPKFADLTAGQLDFYPEDLRHNDGLEVCRVMTAREGQGEEGFSQAYSPTTSSSFGIYDVIPINVDMHTRDTKGEEDHGRIGIILERNDWKRADYPYNKNDLITVRFESKDYNDGDNNVADLATNFRRQAVDALDFGSTYMLGSAKFRLVSFGQHKDPDNGDVNATFKCVESGICPSAPYDRRNPVQHGEEDQKAKLEEHLAIINDVREDREVVPPPVDTENPSKAERKRTRDLQYKRTGFVNTYQLGGCRVDYNFRTARVVRWINILDENKTATIDPAGSLEYTKHLRDDFMDNKPTINSKAARAELNSDLEKAREVLAEVRSGEHDENDLPLDVLNRLSLKGFIEQELTADEARITPGSLGKRNEEIETLLNDRDNLRGRIVKNLPKSKKIKAEALQDSTGDRSVERWANYAELADDKTGGVDLKNIHARLEQKLSRKKRKYQKRVERISSLCRRPIQRQLRNTEGAFISFNPLDDTDSRDGANRYGFGGIKQMKSLLDDFPTGKKIVDEDAVIAMGEEFQNIKAQKKHTISAIEHFLEEWEDCLAQADNNFFVKALVKSESAGYETVSEVDQVKFSIKSRLFRRISGRQKKYGETKASKKYSAADNGIQGRQGFFRFSYKKTSERDYTVHKVILVLRQSSESDAYHDFNFQAGTRDKYSFKIDPIYDVSSELRLNGQSMFAILDSNEDKKSTQNTHDYGRVWYHGAERPTSQHRGDNYFPNLAERGPKLTNEWDVFSVNTDTQIQFSFENGPEMALTAVTEQQEQNASRTYTNLSMLALSLFAGKNVQDLKSVTAFVEEGKQSYKVDNFDAPSPRSTSYAPDIFVDTVLDKDNGIGRYAPKEVLDQPSLLHAKRFCTNHNLPAQLEDGETLPDPFHLFMDGVIADSTSWRDFWVSNAPFSLLEFARKNGKETLLPALPTGSGGRAADSDGRPIRLTISALFTTGNILEDSYKEEFLDYGANTQDLIASVVYREESSSSMFQRRRTVQIKRKDINSNKAIRETFDVSGFVSTRQQAILFGKMLVNQRRFVRRGVEFKTFPSANPIEPGAFIYVDIGLTRWERTSSGVIGADGSLNSPLLDRIRDGSYNFLIYDRDNSRVQTRNSVAVSNGVASSLRGREKDLYVMGIDPGKKRVFRITEVEMDQDSEVTVRAMEYPCDDEDRAYVADFRPEGFDVS